MSKDTDAILVVADISGFTNFMKSQVISISHSKQIIVKLLKTIIKVSRAPLRIAELEGDAVFFYAPYNEKNRDQALSDIRIQLMDFFLKFREMIDEMTGLDPCRCEACQTTRNLKLKIVVHAGKVQFEKIHRREKLFGLEVIVVHRMLKNSVPVNEYLMMTDRLYNDYKDFHGVDYEKFTENFEGIGEVETVVFYPETMIGKFPEHITVSRNILKRGLAKSILTVNTFFDFIGLKKFEGSFKHLK